MAARDAQRRIDRERWERFSHYPDSYSTEPTTVIVNTNFTASCYYVEVISSGRDRRVLRIKSSDGFTGTVEITKGSFW